MTTEAPPLKSVKSDNAKERFLIIDALRGLAAFSVMMYHLTGFFQLMHIKTFSLFTRLLIGASSQGYLGVQVFFVISGFVIALVRPRPPANAAATALFCLRRLVRLAPPYYFSLLCCLVIAYSSRSIGHGQSAAPSLCQFSAHLFFLQDILHYSPLQAVYWTICLEVQFYVFFALLLLCENIIRYNKRKLPLVHLVPFFLSIWFVASGHHTRGWFVDYWYAFALGTITCLLFALCWLSLATVMLVQGHWTQSVVLLTSLILFFTAQSSRVIEHFSLLRAFASLGKVSYSLYLTHALVGSLLFYRLMTFIITSELRMLIFIAGAAAVSIAVATTMYRAVEAPAILLSRRVRMESKSSELVIEATPTLSA